MPDKKNKCREENDELRENTSPVCYANSSELRPEFEEVAEEKGQSKTSKKPKGVSAETANKDK